jgi:cytochrome c oxidase subunit II
MGTRLTRLAKVSGLVGLVGYGATGCSMSEVLKFGWPDGVTPQAERMRELWTWSAVAALIVGVCVWTLILWPTVFHRKRSEELPKQTQYNVPLELVYTAVPLVIIAVLFYYAVVAQNFVNKKQDADLAVEVVSFQWNWEFRYPDSRTSDGETVSTVGSDTEIPLLVVPTQRLVEYRIRSVDVLHSFFVPEFLFKRDVFPHPEKNNTDNVFQSTIDREGAFVGRCAELCGTYHSQMNFEVRALRPELFDQYLRLRSRTNPKTSAPYTAGEALTELGCGELCAPEAITTKPFDTARDADSVIGNGK